MINLHSNGLYWQAQWLDSRGRRRVKSLGPKAGISKSEIQKRIQGIAVEHGLNPRAADVDDRVTLEQWCTRYLDRRVGNLQPSTIRIHRLTCVQLQDFFMPTMSLSEISRRGAADFRLWLEGQMSERTVCKHIRAAKVVFNWALKEDAAKINPFDQVSGTEPVNDTQSPIITVAEAEAMLGVAGDYKAAIALLFYAGIRRGELFRIDWPHVELPTGKLTVVNHLGHETSKVKSRVVRIEPELASCLGWSRPDGRVIHKRIKDSTINDAIAKFAAEVGIERHITCQTFRRSRATLWRDTFPPHVVNKWMGHGERIAMRHYARVTDDYYTPSSGNTIRLSA